MRSSVLAFVSALAVGILLSPTAFAATSYNLEVTKPLHGGTVKVTFTANGVSTTASAAISGNDSAEEKREKIKAALQAKGFTVADGANNSLDITNLPGSTTGSFDPGGTGESKDQLTGGPAPKPEEVPDTASMAFADGYDAIGGDGAPSTFTAGVVTSEGAAQITIVAEVPVAVEGPDRPSDADATGASVSGHQVAADLFFALSDAVEAAGLDLFLYLDGGTIHVQYGDSSGPSRGIVFGTTATNAGVVGTVD
jgi:hypothetical protein